MLMLLFCFFFVNKSKIFNKNLIEIFKPNLNDEKEYLTEFLININGINMKQIMLKRKRKTCLSFKSFFAR